MSSTYSPDLRIELIGTGDQAGIWGSTTNNNLGTLLESAIAGYTSVSISSSAQALTVFDGVADQARYAAIALTTVTSADFAVYIPPSSKLYVFYNASSYVATIYCSTVAGNTTAAGTGVAIPAGKKMALWTDGTNVYEQNNHALSLTLASALPVTSGGTGTTTSTGSGNVVLATSPTIATPTITTPSISDAALTGVPTAPTAAGGTNTTQVATTAYVQSALGSTFFSSGTVMLFAQTAAPTGWTKSTTHNNKALRVVSGTASSGGSVAFTTAFASQTPAGTVSVSVSAGTLSVGSTTLSTAQIPSHTHSAVERGGSNPMIVNGNCNTPVANTTTGATGGGGSHNHSISGSPSITSSTFTGTAINLAVQYVDVIIATKD